MRIIRPLPKSEVLHAILENFFSPTHLMGRDLVSSIIMQPPLQNLGLYSLFIRIYIFSLQLLTMLHVDNVEKVPSCSTIYRNI